MRYCRTLATLLNQRLAGTVNLSKQDVYSVCSKAVELAPSSPEPSRLLGEVLTLLAEYKMAITVLEDWVTKFEKVDLDQVQQVKMNLALTLIRSGGYERAWEVIQQVLRTDRSSKTLSAAANIRSSKILYGIDFNIRFLQRDFYSRLAYRPHRLEATT